MLNHLDTLRCGASETVFFEDGKKNKSLTRGRRLLCDQRHLRLSNCLW